MTFHLDRSGDVAVLTFDRPPVNAFDLDLVLQLEAAFRELTAEPPRGGVVITGAGKSFSAGVDTRAFAGYTHEDRARQILGITRTISMIYALPTPVIGAVNGHALGGGCVVVLGCDMRLAPPDPTIRLGLTEAKAGVPFPAGPLEVIRAELAPDILRRLTLTSATMNPVELHAAGVIDELVPADQLLERAKAMALEMASQPGFRIVKPQLRAPTIKRLQALVAAGDDPLIKALQQQA